MESNGQRFTSSQSYEGTSMIIYFTIFFLASSTYTICFCQPGKKKGSSTMDEDQSFSFGDHLTRFSESSLSRSVAKKVKKKKEKRKAPKKKEVARKAKEGPKAPAVGGMAGTYDPNYQTLAAIPPDVFGEDKKRANAERPKEEPKVPKVGGMAGTYDPNYQTLAAVGGDIFGADKKKENEKKNVVDIKLPEKAGMVGSYDPNYQTLAGINNQEVFGADKKGGGAGQNPAQWWW